MELLETKERFIELRAKSWSFDKIAKELGKAKQTLIDWSKELLDKIKAIAYWDRKLIKEVINNSLQETIEQYESKNGDIKPIPKK